MVTFIDEWRRKFPSCMVVKMLSKQCSASQSSPQVHRRWLGIKTTLLKRLVFSGSALPNVGLVLVHRLRRWPNIKPALVQCLVFTCCIPLMVAQISCWFTAGNSNPTPSFCWSIYYIMCDLNIKNSIVIIMSLFIMLIEGTDIFEIGSIRPNQSNEILSIA